MEDEPEVILFDTKNKENHGPIEWDDSLKFEDFKKFDMFTIEVEMEVLNIYDYNGNDITYNLDRFIEMQKEIQSLKSIINQYKTTAVENKIMNEDKQKVKNWLESEVELPQYLDVLIDNGFDNMERIKDLNKPYLTEIGITKLGHQVALLKNIDILNQSV